MDSYRVWRGLVLIIIETCPLYSQAAGQLLDTSRWGTYDQAGE